MKMSGAFRCSTARKAESMMSTTGSREIALKYAERRHASGQELPGVVFLCKIEHGFEWYSALNGLKWDSFFNLHSQSLGITRWRQ